MYIVPNLIPSTLSHNISIKRYSEAYQDDRYDNNFIDVTGVRLEPNSRQTFANVGGKQVVYKYLMFVCPRATTQPYNQEDYVPGSIVKFKGNEYKIELVEDYYDDKTLHHLEVYLK